MTQPDAQQSPLIDLDDESNGDHGGTLQFKASRELHDLIERQLASAEFSYKNVARTAITYPRPHRAILVEGGRGSGKTTFLLEHLQHQLNEPGRYAGWENVANAVHVLPMVDPTLIEAKDNIIIIIIQMIEAAVDDLDGRIADQEMMVLDQAREDLAEGLSLLDGIGSPKSYGDHWEDATWVMSEGLRKAQKGRNFEIKFNVYLETALSILRKKAFILSFDDVDTNFKHGHLILETIRKYLTSTRLIIILSGDLDLYGRLIRAHIYETFGGNILGHDAKIIGSQGLSIKEAVLELEEQYLLKVVPPQNRIRMLPLGGLREPRKIVVKSYRSGEAALPIWISRRVRAILGEKEGAEHPFVQVIWQEHIRLVISYLRALDLAISDEESAEENLRASRSAVLKVFETRLRMAGVRSDLFDTQSFDVALRTVFKWLVNQQEPATLARFGSPANPNDAIVLHCLALATAQGLERPGNNLKSLIAVLLPAMMLKRTDLADTEMKQKVFAYLENQATPLLSETAARISAVGRFKQDKALTGQRASSFGSVGVAGRDSLTLRPALQRIYDYSSKNKEIDFTDLFISSEKLSSREWALQFFGEGLRVEYGVAWFALEEVIAQKRCGNFSAVLDLVFFTRFSERGEIFRSISALSLLAVIAELLLRDHWIGLDDLSVKDIIPSFDRATLASATPAAGGAHTTSATKTPKINDGEDDPVEQDEPDELDDAAETEGTISELDDPYGAFLKHMEAWHAFALVLSKRENLAPSALGTIAARLHDDLIDLDAEVTQKWGTGEILHRQITNILNVFVAETATSKGRKESPKTTDKPLINALGKEAAELHPLAVILLSCPLIWAFLRPERYDGDDLAPVVRAALEKWAMGKASSGEKTEYQADWITEPEFEIKIGRVDAKNPRTVRLKGFYDLLNVVPRYADKN